MLVPRLSAPRDDDAAPGSHPHISAEEARIPRDGAGGRFTDVSRRRSRRLERGLLRPRQHRAASRCEPVLLAGPPPAERERLLGPARGLPIPPPRRRGFRTLRPAPQARRL